MTRLFIPDFSVMEVFREANSYLNSDFNKNIEENIYF